MRERESKRVRVREIGGVTNTEEKILRELERRHKWRKKKKTTTRRRKRRRNQFRENGMQMLKLTFL